MEAKNYGSPNGNPSTIAVRNGERSELKHLSRSRKKNQTEMSLLTASERDTAQTEALTGNVVFGLISNRHDRREVSWNGARYRATVPYRRPSLWISSQSSGGWISLVNISGID